MSVNPVKDKKRDYKFTTKYIALHVPIASFVRNSTSVNEYSRIIYSDGAKQNQVSIADSVVLKITPSNIKNLLPMYYKTQDLNGNRVYSSKDNRGHLWMIKAMENVDEELEKEKSKMLINTKKAKPKPKRRRTVKRIKRVSIAYED